MSTSRLDPGSRLTSHSAKARRVLVVGPGAGSQGGIAAVIENHRKSSFWREFHCEHFASIRDGSRLDKAFYTLWRWLRFVASIAWSRPAAVAIHTASASSFYRKFGYVLACKVFSVPVILHIHPAFFHDFYEAGGSFAQSLVRRAADWSRVIVFLSREQRDRFAGIFPADRLVVLPNPVDHHQYEAWEDGWQPKPQQVLYMGWIMREKGVYDLVDAIPAIRREFPGVRVLFAGTKEVEELRRYIAERGLADSAQVLGWVAGLERLKLLRTSRMLVLPTYTEGVPNVILEAMASRLPVLTTPVGGIPSVATDEVNCVMVKPGDVAGLGAGICRLLRDDALCERLAAAGLREVSEKYGLEVVADQVRQIYRRALQAA